MSGIAKEWFTAPEIAALRLPVLPTTESALTRFANRKRWRTARDSAGAPLARRRRGRGGGWEYHYTLLPMLAQHRLVAAGMAARARDQAPRAEEKGGGEPWDWYDRLPEARKAVARARADAIDAVAALWRGGVEKNTAAALVAQSRGVGRSTIFGWQRRVAGLARKDWPPALAPRHAGKTETAEIDPRAWDYLKSDYLRLSRPSFVSCYRRLALAAGAQGWPMIPSARTLERRLHREIPPAVMVLCREGEDALKRMYPPQERDRTGFHALEAVNVDGHRWDVFVRWPDGTVGRPMMLAIQDLYSNKMLAWRVDRSENADLVRLAFADVFRDFGIPDLCWLDNGRGFASKMITGGTPNRYRFRVKAEEPTGILTALGIEIHWTRPYSGQSKPIERAFRDFCDAIAKHPAFEGAYTGNKPDAKPENYGSRAVPIADFLAIVEQGIRLHNARPNRNTRVCQRVRSFDEAFAESYARSVIRRAGEEHLRMCLLAAESVRADGRSGSVNLLGNRYWSECLVPHRGQALTVRFDPDRLHDGVHAYRLDGGWIGHAECQEAAGFADTAAAREHARKVKTFRRATKEAAAIERQLSIDELARLLPEVDEPPPPQTKTVRLVRGSLAARPAAAAAAAPDPDAMSEEDVSRTFHAGLLRLVEAADED
jgi:hypothetical protein